MLGNKSIILKEVFVPFCQTYYKSLLLALTHVVQVSNILTDWEDNCCNWKFRQSYKCFSSRMHRLMYLISTMFKVYSDFSAHPSILLLPTLVCPVKKLHQAFVWRPCFCRIYKMYPNGWKNFPKQQHCLHIHDSFSFKGILLFLLNWMLLPVS